MKEEGMHCACQYKKRHGVICVGFDDSKQRQSDLVPNRFTDLSNMCLNSLHEQKYCDVKFLVSIQDKKKKNLIS